MSKLKRRDLLQLISFATAGVTLPAVFSGCAIDPVTGKAGFSLVSEADEIAIDKQQAPHQFAADYGVSKERGVNNYVSALGKTVHTESHRAHMPFNYQVVNANYVNAYAFPGGTIAVTRGILLELDNEAELAALLGHEIGHVTARHSAARMTTGMLTNIAVGGLVAAAGDSRYAGVLGAAGQMSAGAFLAKYSRDNEREADRLGVTYMVAAGQNPDGMVGLMDMLRSMSSRKPSAIELMFSSHPMSDERYANTLQTVDTDYRQFTQRARYDDRYMDMTKPIRDLRAVIEAEQTAETELAKGNVDAAITRLNGALAVAPDDYPGLMLMAKAELTREQPKAAVRWLQQAKTVAPNEGLPDQMLGVAYIADQQFDAAVVAFKRYDERLPGNPNSPFLIGYSYEGAGDRPAAAGFYQQFLSQVRQGEQAEHAYRRLQEWNYL